MKTHRVRKGQYRMKTYGKKTKASQQAMSLIPVFRSVYPYPQIQEPRVSLGQDFSG